MPRGWGVPSMAIGLVLAPPRPAFVLRVSPDNPCLPQGGSTVLTVQALRRDGFHDDIYLTVTNLPPGFAANHAALGIGRDEARVTITAPAEAVPGAGIPGDSGAAAGRLVCRCGTSRGRARQPGPPPCASQRGIPHDGGRAGAPPVVHSPCRPTVSLALPQSNAVEFGRARAAARWCQRRGHGLKA